MSQFAKIPINCRQEEILELLSRHGKLSSGDLSKEINNVNKKTILRDLNFLLELKLIEKTGKARATTYSISESYKLLGKFNKEKYFKLNPAERNSKEQFNNDIFSNLENISSWIFSETELKHIKKLTKKYQSSKSQLSKTILRKEFERLSIELAWKSSQIEGNTYSLLETEALLKSGVEASGHSEEEKHMLLNHKITLDFISEDPCYFQKLSLKKLTEIHSLVVNKLGIEKQIRKHQVGITGTNYRPLDNEFQIKEALENASATINKVKEPIIKSLYCSALLAYIQAFEDGNKRTSRLTANAILMAYDHCPLSYRNIDVSEYKKALLLFYEQNNINYLKELHIEQYEFAIENYFT